ncbi:MAG: hypothetical protein J3Q66DRAFT_385635 [Benniella sp.]|nr:MAG: hypothetical protein J3Q66DRAFT_385635 [Benniella sp.]
MEFNTESRRQPLFDTTPEAPEREEDDDDGDVNDDLVHRVAGGVTDVMENAPRLDTAAAAGGGAAGTGDIHRNKHHDLVEKPKRCKAVNMACLDIPSSNSLTPRAAPQQQPSTAYTNTHKRGYIHYRTTAAAGTEITHHSSDPLDPLSEAMSTTTLGTGAITTHLGLGDTNLPPPSPLARFFSSSAAAVSPQPLSSTPSLSYTPPSIALRSELGRGGGRTLAHPSQRHCGPYMLPQHHEDDAREQLEQRFYQRSRRYENRKKTWVTRLREFPTTLHCLLNNDTPLPPSSIAMNNNNNSESNNRKERVDMERQMIKSLEKSVSSTSAASSSSWVPSLPRFRRSESYETRQERTHRMNLQKSRERYRQQQQQQQQQQATLARLDEHPAEQVRKGTSDDSDSADKDEDEYVDHISITGPLSPSFFSSSSYSSSSAPSSTSSSPRPSISSVSLTVTTTDTIRSDPTMDRSTEELLK